MIEGRIVLLLSLGMILPHASLAQEAREASPGAALRLHVSVGLGGSRSTVPQPLPADWPSRFEPTGGSMEVHRSQHAWFYEVQVGAEPTLPLGGWVVGLPLTLVVGGAAAPALDVARFYGLGKPVAATTLDWWNRVVVHSTAVRRAVPAVGLSLRREGLFSVQVSAQPYAILSQDYEGEDRYGDANTSRVVLSEEVGSGVGARVEVGLPGYIGSPGIFFERHGDAAWQAGLTFRLAETGARRRAGLDPSGLPSLPFPPNP